VLAERVALEKLYNLKVPDYHQDPPTLFEWSSYAICEAFAIKRGYFLARTGAPDVHRAGLEILKDCLDGKIVLSWRPPLHTTQASVAISFDNVSGGEESEDFEEKSQTDSVNLTQSQSGDDQDDQDDQDGNNDASSVLERDCDGTHDRKNQSEDENENESDSDRQKDEEASPEEDEIELNKLIQQTKKKNKPLNSGHNKNKNVIQNLPKSQGKGNVKQNNKATEYQEKLAEKVRKRTGK